MSDLLPLAWLPEPLAPADRARRAVLAALAAHDDLARDYVLKGGLVLQRIYGSPRVSSDVDLNHVRAHDNEITAAHTATLQQVCDRLDATVRASPEAAGLAAARLAVLKWSELLPTVFAEVRYRTEEEPEEEPEEERAVEVQITLCEPMCHTAPGRIDGVPVQVAALSDGVADKLKVLLQQTRRHQVRHADVYDLWFALAQAPFRVDPATVREALLAKLRAWPEYLPLRAEAFQAEAVQTFAEQGYRKLRAEQPALPFAPFDVVWAEIEAFVDAMALDA